MSVLNRKMFQKVAKLKHGGNPYIDHETGQIIPSVTGVPGGMNAVDTSIYQTGQAVQPSALGDTKITGILGGMNEFYPIANDFADALYPQKHLKSMPQKPLNYIKQITLQKEKP